MSQFININSQLDALRIKEFEEKFYEKISDNVKIVPKVTPFKGINTDLLYTKDNKILFVKFMDTSEELFSILDEELIEVMNEEYNMLRLKMAQQHSNINYNFVYIMPYVEIYDEYESQEFVNNNIIDKNKLKQIIEKEKDLDIYLKEENNEIELNMYLLDICPEYYVLNNQKHINRDFKKITFVNDDYEYSATMLDKNELKYSLSINYGNNLFEGGSGTGKTTIMLSRAIKLARVYPQHRFIVFVSSKKLCNQLKEELEILYKDNNNLEIHTLSSFLFKLAKKFDLIADYRMFKQDYEKYLNNLIKQARNVIKNKNMFKGIFIDEAESFKVEEIEFISEFLYKTKNILDIYYCNALNITNDLNIFKSRDDIKVNQKIDLDINYRQDKNLIEFINRFCQNSNDYIKTLRPMIKNDIYVPTKSIYNQGQDPEIIKVIDLEEQIESILWEIDFLRNKKGLDYSDIAIVYPYNKKKLKNGKTIYFQYILRKALEEAKIPYMVAEDEITNITKKVGITISNIYGIKNLEYKAVIFCELEMLYNQTIGDTKQDYQINDFVGDLNKIYLAINASTSYLKIITTFNEDSSEIIKILIKSS
ncbi:DEAD/DEAH box helicase family protein [Intestinibacter bartlettii]|uniref:DEAD/DEAH box helicase family protein n=1 Tax=Intestinibacter bartlettii TaxID=261299 RepID=UPI00082129E5|nr:DEAD/DEAH box helicase family protein [Intestinibacter bartlettii]SCI37142.1 Type III restriction enzyme%2C res subunit [uncultured Clostridium sp.]